MERNDHFIIISVKHIPCHWKYLYRKPQDLGGVMLMNVLTLACLVPLDAYLHSNLWEKGSQGSEWVKNNEKIYEVQLYSCIIYLGKIIVIAWIVET